MNTDLNLTFDAAENFLPNNTSTPNSKTDDSTTEISQLLKAFSKFKAEEMSVEELQSQMLDMIKKKMGTEESLRRLLSLESNRSEGIGANATDVIILKHAAKEATDALKSLMWSGEYTVISNQKNKVISKGRVADCLQNNFNRNMIDKDLEMLTKERDQLRLDVNRHIENHAKAYEAFMTTRNSLKETHEEYAEASRKLKMAAAEIEEWEAKYYAVKQNASEELERASREYDELVRANEENTLSLRIKVRKYDIDLKSRNDEIALLRNRTSELAAIIEQLMEQVEGSDTESNRMASSFNE
ncbi:unnamed protein product [Caenorhabditis auriculariae]|uniref:Transforming acidic coiled-coil-containing protein C-terminal domain-containing protein n=1 Tax=Caenorhabditis auriculariae TaxID=2777116 RepID=A0A8S1HC40_9PELO|nr:unnamed protein product [Caenorhabditis auriculariae]